MNTTDPYAFLRDQLTGIPPIPPLEQMGATIHEPTAEQRMRAHPQQPEPVVYVPGPGGTMVPVLAAHYQPPTATPAAGPGPGAAGNPGAPAAAPVPDVWPKRFIAAGGAVAAVIGSIALAGPHLTEAGHAIEMGGIGFACAGLGAGVLASLLKGACTSRRQAVNVSVNVTNTNTSHSSASSRSHHRSH